MSGGIQYTISASPENNQPLLQISTLAAGMDGWADMGTHKAVILNRANHRYIETTTHATRF